MIRVPKLLKLTATPEVMTERLARTRGSRVEAAARGATRRASPRKGTWMRRARPHRHGARPRCRARSFDALVCKRRNAMADENILDTRPKGTFTAIFTPPWWVE